MKKRDLQVVFTITGGWQAMKPRSGVIGYRGSAPLEGGWIDENCSSTMWNPTRHEGLLELNAGITSIGGGQSADYSPFYNMASVTGIDLSESTIRVIDDYAFYGCTGLESIEIPKRVTEIGDSAFGGCTNLLSVTCLAEEPPTLGSGNFSADAILYVPADSVAAYRADDDWSGSFLRIYPIGYVQHTITYNAESELTDEWVTSSTDTELNEYDSVTGDGVLYLNANVSFITAGAFANNTDLISIDLSDSGITEIHLNAFGGCTALTTVVIPDGVTSIGYFAFNGCSSLTSVNIPSGVTEISGQTFMDCYSLASITIPNSVTTIGSQAFWNCESLTSVTIPNSVTTIDSAAFANCTLTSVTIGSGVTSIGNYAFIGYGELASATCLAAVPPALGSNVFGTAEECTLYVPMDSYEAYTGDADWNSVFTSIRPIGYTYITVSAGEHGTADGSGWYQVDAYVVLTATADEHYHFTQWNDGNTSNPRAIIVGSTDTTYTASFAVDEYTLVLTGDAHTTVTGYGTYAYGTHVQITATADEHYHFVSWSDGNTNATRTITITENMTLGASSAINEYTITVSAGQHGSASGSGTYAYGTQVQISATADTDYHFTQWNDGNTDNPRTIVVTGNATYTASFESDAFTVTITGDAHTTVTGSGSYPYGTQVQISATPDEHYHFVAWSDGDTNATRTITVTGNITLSASSAINEYTLTVTGDAHTTVSGSGTYPYGTQVQISATPAEHYHFTAWSDGNTNATRTITITSDVTLSASSAIDTYTITVNAGQHGTASGSGSYSYGTQVQISATADTGYLFTQWNDGNTDNPRTITVTGDATYTAAFDVMPAVIRYTSTNQATGTWVTNNTNTSRNTYDSQTGNGVLVLNSGVTSIGGGDGTGYSPFCRDTGLTSIDFSDSELTTLAAYTCYNCTNLTTVVIGNTITSLGGTSDSYGVFEQCTSLSSVSIGNSVTLIGKWAFYNCTALTSLNIPRSVTTISDSATKNCVNLINVVIESSTPPTLGSSNFPAPSDALFVPSKADLDAYYTSDWAAVFTVITTRSAYKVIAYNASSQITGTWVTNNTNTSDNYYNSTKKRGILCLKSSVTSIGGGQAASYSPFYLITTLTSVDMSHSGLTSIGTYAFWMPPQTSVSWVAIGKTVTSIGNNAFKGSADSGSLINLKTVICLATTPPTMNKSYNFSVSNDTLKVPSSALSAYQNNSNWSGAFTTITSI